MQLVGKPCIHCQQRISSEVDGQFCAKCWSPAHLECSRQSLLAPKVGMCPGCGASTNVQLENRKAAEEHQEKIKTLFHQDAMASILAGGALMFGGMAVTLFTFGGCIAYGAVFVGFGLLVNGIRRLRQA